MNSTVVAAGIISLVYSDRWSCIANMLDKSRYGASAFKANKSVQANALRFCYETRCLLAMKDPAQCSGKGMQPFTKYYERVHSISNDETKSGTAKIEIADVLAEDQLPSVLLPSLPNLNFETCKQLISLLSSLLPCSPQLQASISSSLSTILPSILITYTHPKLYVVYGQFLRDMLQSPLIFPQVLSLDTVTILSEYAKNQQFEVSADAFETVKTILTTESALIPAFLDIHYSEIAVIIDDFTVSENYFLKRQSLSLLFRLMDNPKNTTFADNFANDCENLKRVMTAMKKETSRLVKVDAFCVFAKMVERMESMKPESMSVKIVRKNRKRLEEFVGGFGRDVEDLKFQDMKQHLVCSLRRI